MVEGGAINKKWGDIDREKGRGDNELLLAANSHSPIPICGQITHSFPEKEYEGHPS